MNLALCHNMTDSCSNCAELSMQQLLTAQHATARHVCECNMTFIAAVWLGLTQSSTSQATAVLHTSPVMWTLGQVPT